MIASRRAQSFSTWTVPRARPTASRRAVWNGHFGCTCYHPLFLFNQFGDLERCLLRPGNAHSAEDRRLVLEPVVARYRERGVDLYFRADAAFAKLRVSGGRRTLRTRVGCPPTRCCSGGSATC